MKLTKWQMAKSLAKNLRHPFAPENIYIIMAEKKTEEEKAAVKARKKAELDELKAQLEAEKDKYVRLYAEFDTYRRRTSEERLQLVKTASAETILGLLPILDDCEIALASLKESTDSEAAKEGTNLIYNKLLTYLGTKGLKKIEAKGEPFDTEFHEAVTMFPAPSEDMKGKVIDVVQNGYLLGDRVLRYAKVVVGS